MQAQDWKKLHKNKAKNAAERNLAYSLNKDDWDLIMTNYHQGGFCDYTNIQFNNHYTPSIERIDDKKGYIRGNIAVVSRQANSVKDFIDKNFVGEMTASDRKIYNQLIRDEGKPFKALCESLKDKYNPEKQGTKIEASKEEVEQVMLHPDARLSGSYRTVCNHFYSRDISFMLSFAEYKAKLRRKKCQLSNEYLGEGDMTPIFMQIDEGKALTKDNCLVVCVKIKNAMDAFKKSTGYDNKKCVKIFTTLQKKAKKV